MLPQLSGYGSDELSRCLSNCGVGGTGIPSEGVCLGCPLPPRQLDAGESEIRRDGAESGKNAMGGIPGRSGQRLITAPGGAIWAPSQWLCLQEMGQRFAVKMLPKRRHPGGGPVVPESQE